jgi:outer membrane receptor protein involved in Fe transport
MKPARQQRRLAQARRNVFSAWPWLRAARVVLVNTGHRILNADLNAIPVIAVERIEVLTDGASSV